MNNASGRFKNSVENFVADQVLPLNSSSADKSAWHLDILSVDGKSRSEEKNKGSDFSPKHTLTYREEPWSLYTDRSQRLKSTLKIFTF